MKMVKVVLGVFLALLVALLGGWFWGASGKWNLDCAVRASELRADLLEARGSVLGARLDIYNVNFGEASRNLEGARGLLRRAGQPLKSLGREDDAKRVDLALARIDEAQRLAGRLDQGANSRAAEAAKTIEDVLRTGEALTGR